MTRARGRPVSPPADAHEWVSFDDPDEERTWVFDVTFLLSRWSCIYGSGCQGVLTGPAPELAQGCCSYGAELSDDEDAARVEAAAQTLTTDQWQFRARGHQRGVIKQAAGRIRTTRLVEDACVFLNRPGFPGGPGCALHRAALDQGRHPMELKPDVCWQLPLRRDDTTEDDGHVTSRVGEWRRSHWGDAGDDFHWWCTEAREAFGGEEPVYRSMREELVGIAGPVVYGQLVAYLETRSNGSGVPLPHPVVRR